MRKLFLTTVLFLCVHYTHAQSFDSCAYWKRKCDTLNHKVFILGNQVDWVQYYLAVIAKNPKNEKYTKGWLIRAVASKLPKNTYIKTTTKKKK